MKRDCIQWYCIRFDFLYLKKLDFERVLKQKPKNFWYDEIVVSLRIENIIEKIWKRHTLISDGKANTLLVDKANKPKPKRF